MMLKDLIETLRKYPDDQVVPMGFTSAHSYRGIYSDLAFEPVANTTIGDMRREAEGAVGETFQGWKGGDYVMGEFTDVWLAEEGDCGEGIGPILLRLMLGDPPLPPEPGPWSVVRKDGVAWVRNGERDDSPWTSKHSHASWERFLHDAEILHLEESA
jgi:hypothetical protein